jgi:hypothetical protein
MSIVKSIKKSKKVIIEEDEMWFPEELWRIIKSFAGIGMEKKCNFGVCNSVGLYCLPSIILEYNYDEGVEVFNPEKLECVVEKKWYCDCCARSAVLNVDDYLKHCRYVSPLYSFREKAIGDKAYAKPTKVANTIGGYTAGKRAVTALRKKLEKVSVKNNIDELATYWKNYYAFRKDVFKNDVIKVIEIRNNTIIGKANKEQFGRELALMLVENKISYDVFQRIMSASICYHASCYVDDDWRAKFIRYGNAENNYQLPL